MTYPQVFPQAVDKGVRAYIRGNIHYTRIFIQKGGGSFQNWKNFPEEKSNTLSTPQIPLKYPPPQHPTLHTTPTLTTPLHTQPPLKNQHPPPLK